MEQVHALQTNLNIKFDRSDIKNSWMIVRDSWEQLKTFDLSPHFRIESFRRGNRTYRCYVFNLSQSDPYLQFSGMIEFDGFDVPLNMRNISSKLFVSHAQVDPQLQGKGIASTIYQRFLDAGKCLMTGERHSIAANKLWRSLASKNDCYLVDTANLLLLKPTTPALIVQGVAAIRLIILGRGWTEERLVAEMNRVRAKLGYKYNPKLEQYYTEVPED